MQKVSTELTELSKEKPTDAEKKEVQGEANMLVKKPADCTSDTNCKFICEKFVGVDGAKEEAVDLTTATDTNALGRRLASGSLVYGSTGYEADSDDNSKGGATEEYTTDASFPEEISGSSSFMTQMFVLISALLVAFI